MSGNINKTQNVPYMLDSEAVGKIPLNEVYAQLSTTDQGLSTTEAAQRLTQCGKNALEEKKQSALMQFLEMFWGPIPWMIEAAAILSIIAGDVRDFIVITALLLFNALIGFWEEHKAGNALAALKKGLALKAKALRDGKWIQINADTLVPGDVILLKLGDVIPADVKLISGEYLSADQSALTGESLPVSKKIGDVAYSGSIVKQGEMNAIVTATGVYSFFGKTAKLVGSAGNVSHFQQTVLRVGNFLIIMAAILCVIMSLVVLFRDDASTGGITVHKVLELVKFVLILAVASIPVAMPAVLSIALALGALTMSRYKAIVARLQSIEEIAGVDILCSDKTGTLTKNQLTLGEPQLFGTQDAQECILAGALASKQNSDDAIDLTVLKGLNDKSVLNQYQMTKYVPFDPVTKRTESTVRGPDGKSWCFTKGAPQVIVEMSTLDEETKKKVAEIVNEFAGKGYRTLGVARSSDEGKSWELLGLLPMFDPPRDDSAETIAQAKEQGLSVKMVTGDDIAIASEISGRLGMGTHILKATDVFTSKDVDHISDATAELIERADGFGRVFPEHKYGIVKALQKRGHIVAMTGDGVNDAPALKQADAGIAVSGATDAARAAAALILTEPGLSVIIRAITTARQIFERMKSYVLYRIAMSLDIMVFVVLCVILFPKVIPLTAIMIIALALLDDIPIMSIAYDNTPISQKPLRWKMGRVLCVSSVLGLFSLLQTLLLFCIGLYVIQSKGTFFGVEMTVDMLQTMTFLQLVVGGHLLLFVTRNPSCFFFRPYPSWILLSAIVGTQIFAALMSGFGWLVPPLPWTLVGVVWGYNLIAMFFCDWVKIITYRLLDYRAKHQQKFLSRLQR
ncbi:MAG: plasma-membrane proton-efflux P-type ATPase [Thermoguttaceae bacterium]